MGYGAISVTSSPTLIAAANAQRQELIIVNNSTSVDIFIGPDSSVTKDNGIPLYYGQTRERFRNGGTVGWLGDVYGITASGSADIRYWETTK